MERKCFLHVNRTKFIHSLSIHNYEFYLLYCNTSLAFPTLCRTDGQLCNHVFLSAKFWITYVNVMHIIFLSVTCNKKIQIKLSVEYMPAKVFIIWSLIFFSSVIFILSKLYNELYKSSFCECPGYHLIVSFLGLRECL